MPDYEYHCAPCSTIIRKFNRGAPPRMPPNCPVCGKIPRRSFGFSVPRATLSTFDTHFNKSVGKVVTNKQQFNDELKRASDIQTERTGIPHNYVPHDPREKLGVIEEGLE